MAERYLQEMARNAKQFRRRAAQVAETTVHPEAVKEMP
jgi:hypothetical protein